MKIYRGSLFTWWSILSANNSSACGVAIATSSWQNVRPNRDVWRRSYWWFRIDWWGKFSGRFSEEERRR